jgi:hypothetical protein
LTMNDAGFDSEIIIFPEGFQILSHIAFPENISSILGKRSYQFLVMRIAIHIQRI